MILLDRSFPTRCEIRRLSHQPGKVGHEGIDERSNLLVCGLSSHGIGGGFAHLGRLLRSPGGSGSLVPAEGIDIALLELSSPPEELASPPADAAFA